MIIDFHTHIFPESIRERREAFFSGEPAFELLYASPRSKMACAEELIAAMDLAGVDRSVVFGFPWKDIRTVRMHNDYILEAVSRYPGRLLGFSCVDPSHPDAVLEADRCLREGASGLGELAFYDHDVDRAIPHLSPLMARCLQRDVPVLIHANEPVGPSYPGKSPMTFRNLYRLIRSFPENKIVLAHWGGGLLFFHLMKKEVKDALKNVFFDTAASPFLYDPRIYPIAASIIGPGKILFGSDFPLISPDRYFLEMGESGLLPSDLDHISGLNAAKLLRLV